MNTYELNKLQDRASIGDVSAINELIDFYVSEQDYYRANLEAERLKYISSLEAYRKLGFIYVTGLLKDKDIEKAKDYFQRAFDLGDDVSGYNIALLLVKENKIAESLPYLTRGVSNDFIPSIKMLANLYIKGEAINKDLSIAQALLKKAYELGEVSVVSSLGKIAYQLEKYEEAFTYFSTGANLKDLDSIYYLGLLYASGKGTRQDFNKAKMYYELGANLNEPRCLYNLSLYYRNGVAVAQNIPLADKLLEQAKENGFKN